MITNYYRNDSELNYAKRLIAGLPVYTRDHNIYSNFKGKRILITGACGSIGGTLYHMLKMAGVAVEGIDTNEEQVALTPSIMLGDFVDIRLPRYDFVFHCAAYKHVKLAQDKKNSLMFSHNNFLKVHLFLKALNRQNPSVRFVLASTDKAAGNSIMGKTKKAAEYSVLCFKQMAVRLVNVVGSRGSIIDRWKSGGVLKICPEDVTRYWMQPEDAAYALLIAALEKPGLYTVRGTPKVSIGAMKEAFVSAYGDRNFECVGLTEGEERDERLHSPSEVLVDIDNPVLIEIL